MLRAHLRGLLKPHTPRSYVELAVEETMLKALEAEDSAADAALMSVLMAVRAVLGGSNVRDLLERSMLFAEDASLFRMLYWKERKRRGSLDTLLEVYSLLEKQGGLDG